VADKNYKVRVIEYTGKQPKKYNAEITANTVKQDDGYLQFYDNMGSLVAAFNNWVYFKEIKED
jgi:hypothetical protein